MGAGKTTFVNKIQTPDFITCFDMSTNSLLEFWYKGQFNTYTWEGLCVRSYSNKETNALVKMIKNPFLKGIMFDRSSIDCLCFVVSLELTKYYFSTTINGDMLTAIENVFGQVEHSMNYLSTINHEGEMVYMEMSNRSCYKNVNTRARQTEQHVETDDWNPSWIFADEESYNVFSNTYSYTSLLLYNLLHKYFNRCVMAIANNDNNEFSFYDSADNPGMCMINKKFDLNDDTSFYLNNHNSAMVNISNFMGMLCDYRILTSLIPFHSHPMFEKKTDFKF